MRFYFNTRQFIKPNAAYQAVDYGSGEAVRVRISRFVRFEPCISFYDRLCNDFSVDEGLKQEVFAKAIVLLRELFRVERLSNVARTGWRSERGKAEGMQKLILACNEAQALYLEWCERPAKKGDEAWNLFVRMANKAFTFERILVSYEDLAKYHSKVA